MIKIKEKLLVFVGAFVVILSISLLWNQNVQATWCYPHYDPLDYTGDPPVNSNECRVQYTVEDGNSPCESDPGYITEEQQFPCAANCSLNQEGGKRWGACDACGERTECPVGPPQVSDTPVPELPSPTVTSSPSCGLPCTDSSQCHVDCPLCSENAAGETVCTSINGTPPVNPTVTPSFRCNEVCDPSVTNPCPLECAACAPDAAGVNKCIAPTVTPSFRCNEVCDPSVTNPCPLECAACAPDTAGVNKCIAPTVTPSFQCNQICDPSVTNPCPQECPACAADAAGVNKCIAPTPTPLSCGATCNPDSTISNQCPELCPECGKKTDGGFLCRESSCKCDGIKYNGTISQGQTITFTAFAKIYDPETNNATVLNMVYHVYRDSIEIANSSEIPASGPTLTTDTEGKPINRFVTSWQYTIPSVGTGAVKYTIKVKINCGYKTAQSLNSSVMVLAANTRSNLSLFDKIWQAFGGKVSSQAVAPTPLPTITIDPNMYLVPSGKESIQLGTFYPLIDVVEKCTEISFTIKYS